jgi:transglutaminase-like putative cysteine protease
VHAPTVVELRASASLAAPVPAGLAEQYLALPADLPSRVVELARDVVGDAATRYDAARRLEAYLRTYPYNEDLPAPPDDRDLVDYFLFERQEGYCDYYASALAVMARSVGVPARLATGYAQGTYDHDARRWVVTEQEGHSWVEVYFDGIGWVEFEPTAGEAALERAGGEATPGALPPLPLRTLRWWERVPWGLVAVAGVVLGLLALLVWLWRPRAQPLGDDIVRDRYNRLLRWGRRLRHPLRDGQTPSEYAGSLADVVRARAEAARWQRARQAGGEAPEQIEQLADAFAEAQYSPHRSDEHRRWQIRTLWSRLRQHLATLWLGPR